MGQDIFDLREQLDEEMRAGWNRSLPFGELVSDRWKRAQRLGFRAGSSIYDSAIVLGDVSVGEETWVGPWVLLDGSGGRLEIGRNCDISAAVHVYTHDTVRRRLSGGVVDARAGGVKIGDDCYIGPHSIVTLGVTIGSQCIVGANSMVTAHVPDRTIVGGTPARRLGRVVGEGAEVQLVYDS